MEQIDADTAVKILVAAAPSATAEPAHKAMRFIEDAARRGRVQVRAFRGHATERGEVIPAVEVADLAFDVMLRHAGKDDGILGEADLVTAGWGTLCRASFGVYTRPCGGMSGSCATRSRAPGRIFWRCSKVFRRWPEIGRAKFPPTIKATQS